MSPIPVPPPLDHLSSASSVCARNLSPSAETGGESRPSRSVQSTLINTTAIEYPGSGKQVHETVEEQDPEARFVRLLDSSTGAAVWTKYAVGVRSGKLGKLTQRVSPAVTAPENYATAVYHCRLSAVTHSRRSVLRKSGRPVSQFNVTKTHVHRCPLNQ